jgi:hypothetical protein
MARFLQSTRNEGSDLLVIFENEHAHIREIVRRRTARRLPARGRRSQSYPTGKVR